MRYPHRWAKFHSASKSKHSYPITSHQQRKSKEITQSPVQRSNIGVYSYVARRVTWACTRECVHINLCSGSDSELEGQRARTFTLNAGRGLAAKEISVRLSGPSVRFLLFLPENCSVAQAAAAAAGDCCQQMYRDELPYPLYFCTAWRAYEEFYKIVQLKRRYLKKKLHLSVHLSYIGSVVIVLLINYSDYYFSYFSYVL